MGSKVQNRDEAIGIAFGGCLASCEITAHDMHVDVAGNAATSLAAGWYWFRLSGPWRERAFAVHVDYGDGLWEADRIGLSGMERGARETLSGPVLFPVHASKIRIGWRHAPVRQPVLVEMRRASVARVSCHLMMRELVARPVRAGLDMLGVLRAHGRRGLGNWLYGRYAGTGADLAVLPMDTSDSNRRGSLPLADVTGRQPMFSILVPTYDPEEKFLRACIRSVLSQTCTDWELCLADDHSSSPEMVEAIEECARADRRIKFIARKSNGHISAATNTALSIATGSYVVLLDHDDELHPMALAEMENLVSSRPELELIFTDEDKIDQDGHRSSPFRKTGYNQELMHAQNCVSHLAAYRRETVVQLGGFREGYEGSQDWDMALRFVGRVGLDRVAHIPKILYHWRTTRTSTSSSASAKPYAADSALRAVEDDLGRNARSDAHVRPLLRFPGSQRVIYPVSPRGLRVSVIVFSEGRRPMSREFGMLWGQACGIDAEFQEAYARAEESNRQSTAVTLATESAVGIIAGGRGLANNDAASNARGQILVFMDASVQGVSSGWFEEIVAQAARGDVGVVGGKLYGSNEQIRNAGYVVDTEGAVHALHRGRPGQHAGHANRARLSQNLSAVDSSCMAVRRSVFESLGGFDITLAEPYCSIDFCLRAGTAGLPTMWTPFAEFIDCREDGADLEVLPAGWEGMPQERSVYWDRAVDRLVESDERRLRCWRDASVAALNR